MNNSHTRLKRSAAVLLLTGLTLLGAGLGTAQAEKDWKTYPGSICRPADMDSPNVGYLDHGFIFNKSATRGLLIYCPIVRDIMSTNAKWTKVVIRYHNPNPAKKIRCHMYTRSPNGRLLNSRKASSPNRTTALIRMYNKTKSGIGVYTLSCSLPPNPGPGGGSPGISLIQVQEAG